MMMRFIFCIFNKNIKLLGRYLGAKAGDLKRFQPFFRVCFLKVGCVLKQVLLCFYAFKERIGCLG